MSESDNVVDTITIKEELDVTETPAPDPIEINMNEEEVDNDLLSFEADVEISEGTFTCRKCDKSFKTQKGFAAHQKYISEGNDCRVKKVQKCPDCGEVFDKRTDLFKHLETHKVTNIVKCKGNRWQCKECFQVVPDKSRLKYAKHFVNN